MNGGGTVGKTAAGVLDAPDGVTVTAYRHLMSHFPTGVSVVTAVSPDGRPYGFTCTSLTSVTLVPPTILICVRTGSVTLDVLRDGGAFAVNLLHAGSRAVAERFASPADRFAGIAWKRIGVTGQPWLADDTAAVAECRVTTRQTCGDHEVVFGRVLATYVTAHARGPLVYGLRRFGGWPAEELLPEELPSGELP